MATPKILALIVISSILCNCSFSPPYNEFRKDQRTTRAAAKGAALGTAAGLISHYVLPGMVIGTATGAAIGAYKNTKRSLIAQLQCHDIEYIEYGNLRTLIIPVDKYYELNSARLNDLEYQGLLTMIKLLSYTPDAPYYVAAFSDDVGSDRHKEKMTQAQAEAMLTFLWANGFKSAQLHAQGWADYFPVSDNNTVHGSAQNRRIEIQWSTCKTFAQAPVPKFYEK